MAEESKRPQPKSELKEDRLSDLPDCLIQHILSFLPTTKQAIQTTVLSKRWHDQWTGVPVLIFNSNGKFCQNVLEFHNCSKIEKLHCLHGCFNYWDIHRDSDFDEIISLATRTHVEDLVLNICCVTNCPVFPVPELFFDNTSLRKLGMRKCGFMPKGKVNWANLKDLSLDRCSLTNEAIEHVLSGSPLLELISISACHGCDKFVVTSKYLKSLVLESQELGILEISCPNLKQLSVLHPQSTMLAQAIKNVLSVSSLLESMELKNFIGMGHLVISSESLKILVIDGALLFSCLQVSCSKLEKLECNCVLHFEKVEFMNLPSSVQVNLDLSQWEYGNTKIRERFVKDILQQLHHVNELKLGWRFIKFLPGLDWSATDDKLLTNYIKIHGEGNWRNIPKKLGLQRCWKCCMLRWRNYLRPGIKRGNITNHEGYLIIRLHYLLGDRWSLIAGRLWGRTDNEIKNYWNTIIRKKLQNKKRSTRPITTIKV